MSELERFFAAQARFYEGATDAAGAARALAGEFAGWAHRPERVALYADFAVAHIRTLLQKTFPATRDALPPPAWEALVTGYYATRPGRASYEVSENARAFPAFVEGRPDLPPFVAALARFEWTIQEVYASRTEVPEQVERLTVNPTLEVLEHPWALIAYLQPKPPRPAPAPGDETALLWRRRDTQLVHWMAASARTLLALKLAGEGIAPADAARAGGVPVEGVQAALDEAVGHGLVLAP